MLPHNIYPKHLISPVQRQSFNQLPVPRGDHQYQLPGSSTFGMNNFGANGFGFDGRLDFLNPNPDNIKVDLKKSYIEPKNFVRDIIFLTLARDFADSEPEDGLVKLELNNPEFLKNNMGLILFTGNNSDPNYLKTLKVFNNAKDYMSSTSKKGEIKIDIPFGIVNIDDPSAGGNTMQNYFKIKHVPTIVYKSPDGNYHHFNGPTSIYAALKYAAERDFKNSLLSDLGSGGLFNMVNLEQFRFAEPKDIRIINNDNDTSVLANHQDATVGARVMSSLTFT